MKIGDWVIISEKVEMYDITYEAGHRFKITGCDDIRGFNLEDSDGNKLGETRFVNMRLDKSTERDKKILK